MIMRTQLIAGSAGGSPAPRRRREAFVKQPTEFDQRSDFALRAQCGQDVRAPSIRLE